MAVEVIIFLAAFLNLLLVIVLSPAKCKHEVQTYFDATCDELAGDQSEACFSKCQECGKMFVITSGFQSGAHFENCLSQSELGGSQAVKKI